MKTKRKITEQEFQTWEYSFRLKHAVDFGLEEAILLKHIVFWINKNRNDGNNFRDGRTWFFQSVRAFRDWFPFWTDRQIQRIIESLEKKQILLEGPYNNGLNRTKWYGLVDENSFLNN